jgi:hypothetical protein
MTLRKIIGTCVAALLIATVVGTPARAAVEEVSGFGFGSVTRTFNDPGTPLLDHFYFRFQNDDHHFGHASAYPQSNGTILIAFQDQNSDDEYFYRVAHQRVSSAGLVLGSFSDVCLTRCIREIPRPVGNYVFVLTGFRFFYIGGRDRHFDELGVLENNGTVTTYLNDKEQDSDDTFITHISYAWVPRARFSVVSALAAEVQDAGGVRRSVPVGDKVIRGFRVNSLNGDRHIRELGVMTNFDNIEIYDSDNTPGGDRWDYDVRYAVLA